VAERGPTAPARARVASPKGGWTAVRTLAVMTLATARAGGRQPYGSTALNFYTSSDQSARSVPLPDWPEYWAWFAANLG
jgi:hypothetical protein